MAKTVTGIIMASGNAAAIAALAAGDTGNAMLAATPGGVLMQEAAGQAQLVASQDMPHELRPSREAFEAVGFTFGARVDDVFQSATLPVGWTRRPTEHSMWSEILDERGRVRVAVFYKAAFYDRRADARLKTRLEARGNYELGVDKDQVRVFDTGNGDAVLFSTAVYQDRTENFRKIYGSDLARDEAVAWLEANYPDWQNPLAYWSAE